MVSYIKPQSRSLLLKQGYQAVRRHFDDLAESLDDTIHIVLGDNWYSHWRPFQDFAQNRVCNTVSRRLLGELNLSPNDFFIDTYPIARREPYELEFSIESRKIKEATFRWYHFRRSSDWSSVFIAPRYQGRGIATRIRETLEASSRELGVDVFCASNIIDTHVKYWSKQKDYQLQGNRAYKILN